MKTEVKAKSTSQSESEYWNSTEHNRTKSRKKCPKRGKRYSRAQKDEILHYAKNTSVSDAASKFDVTETTIYEWQRADKRRNINGNGNESPIKNEDPAVIRDRKILATWREHPGYGPSQVRLALKRKGFKVSVGTVRHIMEENGYLPPKLKRKERTGRYEANRPRELYHLDFYHFYVHKQKSCVLFIEDDFSRFIPGWAMAPAESAEPVIKCFEHLVQRYGRPEGAMSDRGSAFHSWKGLSRCTVLNHLDQWTGSLESFCTLSEVPYPTLEGWKRKDAVQPYIPASKRPIPPIDSNISDIARMIIEDYARWQGSLGGYLVKIIQNCQHECDLRLQEEQLRKYAETEKLGFLGELEREHDLLVNQCKTDGDLALQLSENAVFGGLVLQRAFWEEKFKALLTKLRGCTDTARQS